MNEIRKNQIKRILNQEKRKRKAKIRLVAGALVVSMGLTLAYFSFFNKNNASADTSESASAIESVNESNEAYTDKVLSYKIVSEDSPAYKAVKVNPEISYRLKKGDYIEFYGQKDTWAKISKNGQIAYIQYDKLIASKDNELVVKRGLLMDGKNYTIPEGFNEVFDPEVENALLVMIEAMKREGYDIGVSKKLIEKDYEKQVLDKDAEFDYPDYKNHTLRTGKSVEFSIKDNKSFKESNEGRWLQANAHKFGFILRYPRGEESVTGFYPNDRIYRYVGVDIATDMYENDMTLEEYFDL